MNAVRAGLFGLTHPHSLAHLRTLNQSDMVSEVVLYDSDREAVERTKTDLGAKVSVGYTQLDELLEQEQLQFGVACFQNNQNPDLCVRLLAAGIHVISEKPIGASASEVQRVVDAAQTANLELGVMYQNRYHPATQEARRLIQEGAIGRVTACESRLVTSQVKFRNPKHWLFDRSVAGGGILSWLGCHYIDLLTYVMGQEIVSVSGMVDTLSGEDIDVEDVATLSFRFADGALGSMQAGYQLALSKSGYTGPNNDTYMAFRGHDGRVFWTPTGTSSELHLESMAQGWQTAPQRTFSYTLPTVEAYGGAYGVAFLERFVLSSQGRGDPPASGDDALKVARIIEAAYQSNQTGQRVDLQA